MLTIIIADRGFVWVGFANIVGDMCIVSDARQIRRWGTTKGLGELASSGPLKNTILDPCGTVRVPMRAVIALIECEAKKWTE